MARWDTHEELHAMASDQDISLAASDVCDQTSPHIAKPPRDYYDSESDRDREEHFAAPPQHGVETDSDESGGGSAKRAGTSRRGKAKERDSAGFRDEGAFREDDVDDGDDEDDEDEGDGDVGVSPPFLDSDVVKDSPENPAGGTDGPREKEETQRKDQDKGEDGGFGGKTTEEAGKKRSEGQETCKVHGPRLKEMKDLSDGNSDMNVDITVLVDRVELALRPTSRGEEGAFDDLVEVLKVLLPQVLYNADELEMMRGKVKNLLVRNRSLQKEVQRAVHEAEKRTPPETVSVGTSTMILVDIKKNQTEQEKIKDDMETNRETKEGSGATEGPMKADKKIYDDLKRDVIRIRAQCKELMQVNHSWERYTRKQAERHATKQKEYAARLAAAEQGRKKLEKVLEIKFKEYDQTLIFVKRSEDHQRAEAARYKQSRDDLRAENEELKRQLKLKDEAFKRLAEMGDGPKMTALAKDLGVLVIKKYPTAATAKVQAETQRAKVPSAPEYEPTPVPEAGRERAAAKGVAGGVDESRPKTPREERSGGSPPLSPRGPPTYENQEAPMSLTRAELKDQVLLYREQLDTYQADFRNERRDREKAMGQVDSLKKELEATKKRLKEIQRERKQEEGALFAPRIGRRNIMPEDIQKQRLQELRQESRKRNRNLAYGREHAYDYADLAEQSNIYAEIP